MMSLRDEALRAMAVGEVNPPNPHLGTLDDPHRPHEAALDGLLGWLTFQPWLSGESVLGMVRALGKKEEGE